MPSSSRIIKSVQVDARQDSDWIIDTAYQYEEEAEEYESYNQEAADELAQAKQKSSQLIQKAQTEKEIMIQEAEEEIARLKEEAYREAFEAGRNDGFTQGFNEGQAQGFEKGKEDSQELMNQARAMITEAQLNIEEYIQEKKDSLLSLAIHMAQKIVQEQLDLTPDGIMELVHPVLHQLDRKEDYVSLTVHSSKRKELRERLPMLEKNYPGVRFVVFGDDNIDPLGCIVESAHKVVDLQVRKQLETMVEEMKEREREMN